MATMERYLLAFGTISTFFWYLRAGQKEEIAWYAGFYEQELLVLTAPPIVQDYRSCNPAGLDRCLDAKSISTEGTALKNANGLNPKTGTKNCRTDAKFIRSLTLIGIRRITRSWSIR